MSLFPENRQFVRARQSFFHYKKITGTLTINIFFRKCAETFLNPYTLTLIGDA